jgi:hypothetical protein
LALSGAPAFGLKFETVPLYIAASKNTPGIDLDKWRAAYAGIVRTGHVRASSRPTDWNDLSGGVEINCCHS